MVLKTKTRVKEGNLLKSEQNNSKSERVPGYSQEFKIHAVQLYYTYKSSTRARAKMNIEINNRKWPYQKAPTEATILYWASVISPDEIPGEPIDPSRRSDYLMLNTLHRVDIKIIKDLHRIRITNIRDIMFAMNTSYKLRRDVEERMKSSGVIRDTVKRKIKKLKSIEKHGKTYLRDGIIDLLERKEKLGIG